MLVTGATGFIGGAVVRALVSSGHEVVGLVRSEADTRSRILKESGVRLVVGDMLKPDTYQGLAGDVDAVIHAAQFSVKKGRVTRAKVAELGAANQVMTSALANACAATGKRLVFTSSTLTYGDCGDEWITEATPFNPTLLGETHARETLALRKMHAAQSLWWRRVSSSGRGATSRKRSTTRR